MSRTTTIGLAVFLAAVVTVFYLAAQSIREMEACKSVRIEGDGRVERTCEVRQ